MAHNFQNMNGGGMIGSSPTMPATQRQILSHPASSRWWYKHHPARWYVNGDQLLPLLAKLVGEPGVNGVSKNGDIAPAQIAATRKGWTIIPWTVIDGGYVRVFQGKSGPVHLSIFEQPKMVANRTIIKQDQAAYRQFLLMLLDTGVIDPIDPDILEGLIAEKQASLSLAVAQKRTADVAVIEHEISVMNAVLNPPEPKRRAKK
jgi:hypothetical protein